MNVPSNNAMQLTRGASEASGLRRPRRHLVPLAAERPSLGNVRMADTSGGLGPKCCDDRLKTSGVLRTSPSALTTWRRHLSDRRRSSFLLLAALMSGLGSIGSSGGCPTSSSLGQPPLITAVTASPNPASAGDSVSVSFSLSHPSGHRLNWTAAVAENPGAGGVLEPAAASTGDRELCPCRVTIVYRTRNRTSGTVTIAAHPFNEPEVRAASQSITIQVQ